MTRKRRDTDTVIQVWNRQGWYPAPWSHHPGAVKDAIRAMRWRPRIKECFYNCQMFLLNSGLEGLEYHEGWAQTLIPVEHAWLVYKGERLDLTLGPDRAAPTQYLRSVTSTPQEVRANCMRTGQWTVVKTHEMHEIGPHAEVFRELERIQQLVAENRNKKP